MDVSMKGKQEKIQNVAQPKQTLASVAEASLEKADAVIGLSTSSSSDTDSDVDVGELVNRVVSSGEKKTGAVTKNGSSGLLIKRKDGDAVVLPVGFLKPLPREKTPLPLPETVVESTKELVATSEANDNVISDLKAIGQSCKQFWKAGDYEGDPRTDWTASTVGMDHVRVHPKFLHSNATSHKWALGAFAELLDNALDEVCNGATYVNIDVIVGKKDNSMMLLIEDNGGGMDPDIMRQCMSLGYSMKSKMANTIGQYGNGFKTSTMRLGADVIVFSRSRGKDGRSPTQSIGLLSYTFLKSTGKEDIVVPMVDFERKGREWRKIIRSSPEDWDKNVETILQWSPFSSEADVLSQFNMMNDRGTRIIIYNLWEDDQGQLELDFNADPHDIQIRGVNREEKNIQMAGQYPNSRHFLTYRHSLRSYASILYLRIPPGFRIILRGKDVDHHNIVNDMMMSQEITYRPQFGADGVPKESNMVAVVTIGFVKDAKHHIDVSGFNVYHKNRLIKPFWRLWNPAGSGGRGVIGVLEANFVEPAHDKQGFERTIVLSRLEARLIQMQKSYWRSNCHKIGYFSLRNKNDESMNEDCSPDHLKRSSLSKVKNSASTSKAIPVSDKLFSLSNLKQKGKESENSRKSQKTSMSDKSRKRKKDSSSASEDDSDDMHIVSSQRQLTGKTIKSLGMEKYLVSSTMRTRSALNSKNAIASDGSNFQINEMNELQLAGSHLLALEQLKEENQQLKERLHKKKEDLLGEVLQDLQYHQDKRESLESEIRTKQEKIDELNKEQESLIDIFSEERDRRDAEERNLRKKLQEASNTIQELRDKVKLLERMHPVAKRERC